MEARAQTTLQPLDKEAASSDARNSGRSPSLIMPTDFPISASQSNFDALPDQASSEDDRKAKLPYILGEVTCDVIENLLSRVDAKTAEVFVTGFVEGIALGWVKSKKSTSSVVLQALTGNPKDHFGYASGQSKEGGARKVISLPEHALQIQVPSSLPPYPLSPYPLPPYPLPPYPLPPYPLQLRTSLFAAETKCEEVAVPSVVTTPATSTPSL